MNFDKNCLRLYAVTDRSWLRGQTLEQQVEAALQGGATCVQLREKQLDREQFIRLGQSMSDLCRRYGVPLIINDDPALAHAVGAAGVHLGGTDGDIGAARALLGPTAIIGASCYDQLENAERAVADGASYVAFGAFFPTTTKVTTSRAHPDLLRQSAALGVPRVAIGGLTPDNVGPLIAAGADLLAVVSGVFAADDPVATLRAYLARFQDPSA